MSETASPQTTSPGSRARTGTEHYHVLLVSLVALFVFAPLAEQLPLGNDIVNVLFLSALVFGTLVGQRSRLVRRMNVSLATAAALLIGICYVVENDLILVVRAVLLILFLLFVFAGILRDILQTPRVDAGLLSGAVSAYLLLGLAWSVVYGLLHTIDPDAFAQPAGMGADAVRASSDSGAGEFVYFSFVTLTTLGFGDITPRSEVARTLTAIEALVGQLYLAILIAALVGIHIAQRMQSDDGGKS